MKKIAIALAITAGLTACNDAQIASSNLSKAADNFEVLRRVVFMNGITDAYMLSIEGLCAINDQVNQLEVVCKHDGGFKKHFLGLSDNVTYFVEQMEIVDASVNHYRITFKPQTILPDIDLRGDGMEAITPRAQ